MVNLQELDRPEMMIDLSGPDGNVFAVMGMARKLVSKEMGSDVTKEFKEKLDEEMKNPETSYENILKVVNEYVELIDVSGTYVLED